MAAAPAGSESKKPAEKVEKAPAAEAKAPANDEAAALAQKVNSLPEDKAVKTAEVPDNSSSLMLDTLNESQINEDIYAGKKTK